MSRRDFAPEEFADRRRRTRLAMVEAGLDWLLLFHPVSIHWLTGSGAKSYQAFQCLLVSLDEERLHMFTRESERAEFMDDALVDELTTWGGPDPEDPVAAFARLVADLGLSKGRVAMEVPAFYLNPLHYTRLRDMFGEALAPEPSTLVHDLKMVKSPTEIAYIRKAASIADSTVETLANGLRAGRTETSIVADIYGRMLSLGGSIPPTPVNFVSGERAAFSHGAPTERVLRVGDTGNAEYCVAYRRYCVSVGRQFSIGAPSARLRTLYSIVREAGDAAMAAIRDDVPARLPFEEARKVIAAAGLDAYRVHVVGYGIAPGFPPTAGDAPALASDSRHTLKAGMLLSICPPLFIAEERIGVRLVDNILVTRSGAERITKSSRDLIVID